jgi:hypothetical protein
MSRAFVYSHLIGYASAEDITRFITREISFIYLKLCPGTDPNLVPFGADEELYESIYFDQNLKNIHLDAAQNPPPMCPTWLVLVHKKGTFASTDPPPPT